jgi:hypothetical protein
MIMEPDGWYIDGCTKASDHYKKLYDEWTAHLPKREELTPYHSGPHSIKHFEHAFEIAGIKKGNLNDVIEVGFCLGHSAEIMFRLGATHVTSIENSFREQTMQAQEAMEKKRGYMHRFSRPEAATDLIREVELYGKKYALGFIDGDHSKSAISADYALMRALGVPWVLFDDFWPHWGDTQIVMQDEGICPIAILGTMALCQFT